MSSSGPQPQLGPADDVAAMAGQEQAGASGAPSQPSNVAVGVAAEVGEGSAQGQAGSGDQVSEPGGPKDSVLPHDDGSGEHRNASDGDGDGDGGDAPAGDDYERERLERITRNQAMLERLKVGR